MSSLDDELKVYNNLIKQNDLAFSKLSQFFKIMSKNGTIFVDKTKKSLEDYFLEIKKENSSATHIICLMNFYNGFMKYLDKMKDVFKNIDIQCANKAVEFSNKYKNQITASLNPLSKINVNFKDNISNLEKVKNDYFNSSKLVVEQKYKIKQLADTKNKKEEENNKNILKKYEKTLEKNRTYYLLEINNYNKAINGQEKNYQTEIEKIYNTQEEKIKYLYENLNAFKNEISNWNILNMEIINLIEKLNKSTNVPRDVELFKDEYNFCNDKKVRFIQEEFLDYEVYTKKIEEIKSSIKMRKNNSSMFGFGKKDDENKEDNKKISELIQKILYKKENLTDNDSALLMTCVEKETDNNRFKLIDLLKGNIKKNAFIKVDNLFNFNFLANMIQLVIDKNSYNIESLYHHYIFIIKFSENMLCDENGSISIKNYLCYKISKLAIFAKKEFWLYLINGRINDFTVSKTKQDIEKEEKGKTLRRSQIVKNSSNYYSKFKGFFNFDNNNKKLENEIVLGLKYQENLPIYCLQVIEEYIQHLSNFNFSKAKSKDIIKELYKTYNFDKQYYEYFLAEINSNTKTPKTLIEIFQNEGKTVNYQKLDITVKNRDIISNCPKINALLYSIKYLDINDYLNLMILNLESYKHLKKYVYLNILLKYPNINVEKKIKIWKIILNYRENKKLFNYKEIIEKIKNSKKEDKSKKHNNKDIIDLDVVRTSFKENKEINQSKISNILKSIFEIIPDIKYNQGMNYIAAFLLNITKDEEEAFYLYYGLMTSTEYGDLFKNDLAKLKKIFYIFERLISIFLPELYTYFLNNNIKVSYFLSSWFITLFTNTFQFNTEEDNPKILLKIFDLFFFDGWKSMIIASIFLIKNYESKILVFNTEELIHFLITSILQEKYFQNDNYERFMYNVFNFKIEDELIKNIEEEIEIKQKMPDLGKNLKFQIT